LRNCVIENRKEERFSITKIAQLFDFGYRQARGCAVLSGRCLARGRGPVALETWLEGSEKQRRSELRL
jgi:hypothetical protein